MLRKVRGPGGRDRGGRAGVHCRRRRAGQATGKLFSPDTFAPLAGTFKERSGDVVKALCLHVAHTCNLNCSYCFASQGKYHGERALMSYEVGKRALDFLMEHSGSRHQSGGGLLRRRTADELGRGQTAGGRTPAAWKRSGARTSALP